MPCSYCKWAGVIGRRGAEKGIVKGLCKNCYYRQKRYGSLEHTKVRHSCTVHGCDRLSVAHGYCMLHYQRWMKYGHLDETRPSDWGKRESHPLYQSWRWLIRKQSENLCGDWREDFWSFVKDVGERPTEIHRLRRIDESNFYGPLNFEWVEANVKLNEESDLDYARRYMREYREKNPERFRNSDLKKSHGIDANEYDKMLLDQGGVCAICGKLNTAKDHRTGLPRRLAVDHCHITGRLRKLLCQHCNQGLGNFKDDPQLLRAAADYLTL